MTRSRPSPVLLPALVALGALACVPETFDISADDYLTIQDGPSEMVGADGNYNGGWYRSFEGTINPEAASGREGAFKGWLHFSLANDEMVVSANLADMNQAGNSSIAFVDVQDGTKDVSSVNETFGDNNMQITPDFAEVVNGNDGSFIRMLDDTVEFDMIAGAMRLEGTLARLDAEEYVQITRYHDGYGQLQWYGVVEVIEGTITLSDGTVRDLPAGLRGTYDRMAGHRRTHQHWNWVSAATSATRQSDSAVVDLALSMTQDGEGARPRVESKKYAVWIDGALSKVESLEFTYTVQDEETWTTSDWVIASDEGDEDRVDLDFTPLVQRRDLTGYLWFYETNYNQYIGSLSGTVQVDGETYTIDEALAVTEDARLTL